MWWTAASQKVQSNLKMKHPLLKADESSSALNYTNKRKLKFDPFPPFTAGHSLFATTVPHLNDKITLKAFSKSSKMLGKFPP